MWQGVVPVYMYLGTHVPDAWQVVWQPDNIVNTGLRCKNGLCYPQFLETVENTGAILGVCGCHRQVMCRVIEGVQKHQSTQGRWPVVSIRTARERVGKRRGNACTSCIIGGSVCNCLDLVQRISTADGVIMSAAASSCLRGVSQQTLEGVCVAQRQEDPYISER